MSRSFNQITIVGNLGQDPDIRSTKNGRLATLSVATSVSYKDGNDWKEKTQWHRVKVWQHEKGRQLVDAIEKSGLKKGGRVMVVGLMEYGEYTNNEGQKVKTAEIKADTVIIFDAPSRNAAGPAPAARPRREDSFDDFPAALNEDDDDLPF